MRRIPGARTSGKETATFADRLGINPAYFWMWGRPPARRVEIDDLGICHVYGYAEAVEVLGNPHDFSNDVARLMVGETELDDEFHEGTLLQSDPPEHNKLRKIISRAFTPRMVAGLEPRIAEVTGELLDAVAGSDAIELSDVLTYPMPVIVICELLGVPHSDRDLFRQWVDRMATSAVALTSGNRDPNQEIDPQAAMRVVPELFAYLREHAADRRRTPREDLLTELVQAEVDGERLSDAAVVNFANELLVVGHVTTTALLGNTVLCLAGHPDTAARVRDDRSMIPALVEESLRFMSPIVISYRAARRRTEIAGVRVQPDQLVAVNLAAANRDDRTFADPHRFDLDRDPNPHIAFGRGIHFCLGAPLARLEGRVAMELLLERFPKLRTDPDRAPTFIPLPHVITTSEVPLLIS